jgi:calcineurin-like phosphoesterase family protein
MARDIWFISDTHFGHAAIIAFGQRPFADTEEMDEALIERWTAHVKPSDLIYHLGDIAWTRAGLRLFAELPGTKRLIIGNHDDGKACAPMVQKLELVRDFDDGAFVATHMPKRIEPGRLQINVHGHVHLGDLDDPRYVNICVERTDYRPLHIDELRERVARATAAAERLLGARAEAANDA